MIQVLPDAVAAGATAPPLQQVEVAVVAAGTTASPLQQVEVAVVVAGATASLLQRVGAATAWASPQQQSVLGSAGVSPPQQLFSLISNTLL